MDRISQLPECIVHRILSLLNTYTYPPEAVRMSELSKTWFHLTASFPVLDFDIVRFRCREKFFKYVECITNRFCHTNVTARKYRLVTTLEDPTEIDVVNRCMELILSKGVTELVIYITESSESLSTSMPRYRLPNILLSVSVLKSLTIYGCELPSSLMLDVVKFKLLTKLTLIRIDMDDEVITHLTTSCPRIEEIYIAFCHGFKRFRVYGHQNLRQVDIYYEVTPVEIIDIQAPNLSDLTVGDSDGHGAPRMNVASCKKLTTVSYKGHPLNSNGFTDFLSNFPFIENLVLETEFKCNNLKFSSHSLRTLLLHSNCDLEDIEFSTPNLVLFVHAWNPSSIFHIVINRRWPRLRDSTHLKSCMQCYPRIDIGTLWFQKLRQYLDKKDGFKVLKLSIHIGYFQTKFVKLGKLKATEMPPYELEHVELQLNTECNHVDFVDAVLWCCRPRSLTLRSRFRSNDYKEQSHLVKFTYKKLLQQEDKGHTNIQIVSSSSSEAQKQFMDLKSLSMAIPLPYGGQRISFIKEGVV